MELKDVNLGYWGQSIVRTLPSNPDMVSSWIGQITSSMSVVENLEETL